MRDYSTARGVIGLLEFLFWGVFVLGIFLAFSAAGIASRGFGGGSGLMAATPGLFLALLALLGVAIAQLFKAAVDTAEFGQQGLKVARDQLEVSKQAIKQSQQFERSFADLARRLAGPEAGTETARDNAETGTASYASPTHREPDPAPYADQLGVKVAAPRESVTHDLNGRKLTENPDGTFILDGRSFASKAALQEYLKLAPNPALVARSRL